MMPKRILDGYALWGSDKLAEVNPVWVRPEFANLLPLAFSNGVFEINPQRIWARVYAYNRPDMTPEKVAQVLAEFERAGLLFRWIEPTTGKTWGYWVGIEKPGRLPGVSRRGKNEAIGPEPPTKALYEYMGVTAEAAAEGHEEANGIHTLPHGSAPSPSGSDSLLGFGLGSGLGNGLGVSLDVDGESITREIQDAWPYKDSSSGTERLIFDAIETEITDRKCSAQEACDYVRDRVLAIAKVIKAQWTPSEYRMLPLSKLMRERSYRNEDAVFSNPRLETKAQPQVAEIQPVSAEGSLAARNRRVRE